MIEVKDALRISGLKINEIKVMHGGKEVTSPIFFKENIYVSFSVSDKKTIEFIKNNFTKYEFELCIKGD